MKAKRRKASKAPSEAGGIRLNRADMRAPVRVTVDLGNLTRDDLVAAYEQITLHPPSVTYFAAVVAKQVLMEIIDPRRNSPKALGVHQIALLAHELIRRKLTSLVKVAVSAAIRTLAQERSNDIRFYDYCLKDYRRIGRGVNPAKDYLLEFPEEVIEMARKHIPSVKK